MSNYAALSAVASFSGGQNYTLECTCLQIYLKRSCTSYVVMSLPGFEAGVPAGRLNVLMPRLTKRIGRMIQGVWQSLAGMTLWHDVQYWAILGFQAALQYIRDVAPHQ